ncbi:GntR family transcriptional regulator, partial [Variovorax paradoxus]|uniref:GntR family transcriptional regulator n=1 Tax=Variovorax paradoxus TaxID=34073 RepID=UPI00247AC1A2
MKVAASSSAGEPGDSGASQAVKAQLRLREMILAGELPGGARIAEVAISEQLGVSRTPVRTALMRGDVRTRVPVNAVADPEELGVQDLVVIAVKAPALAGVAER